MTNFCAVKDARVLIFSVVDSSEGFHERLLLPFVGRRCMPEAGHLQPRSVGVTYSFRNVVALWERKHRCKRGFCEFPPVSF
jgi:hypothetical protein